MSENSNDLFIWKNYKGFMNRGTNDYENRDLNYWKLRTVKAANDAARSVSADYKMELSTQQTSVDDAVYSEAKDIVKSWLTNKKIYGQHSDRQSFLQLSDDESDLCIPTRSEIHREWDHLVQQIETREDFKAEIDSYLSVDNGDVRQDKRLKSVMSNLHKKTFANSSKLRKIDSSKEIDMKKRIEDRQEEVKRKREERLKKEELLNLEKLAQKEARIEAIKMLKEEKKQKEMVIKKEEELLEIEMNKIRAELQRKREQEMIELKRLKETQKRLKKQEDQINSSRQLEENSKAIDSKIAKNTSERFEIISEFVERKFLNKTSQLVRRCFQVWRNEAIKSKIQMEKAVVWFQWKNARKVFRSWQLYARHSKINRLIEMDQQRIKLMQMKESMATDFWKRNLLKKCIFNWSLHVLDEKETRWCQKLEEMRKKKIVAYIETLQEKALENQDKIDVLSLEAISKHKEVTSIQSASQRSGNKTERVSDKEIKIEQNNSSCQSARLVTSKQISKEAWTVSAKDAYLPVEKPLDDPEKPRGPLRTQQFKSLKPPKVVNSFVHRDAAQKELIKQQQEKIKEQQRLIDEIKTDQFLKQIKGNDNICHSDMDPENKIQAINPPCNQTEKENPPDSTKVQDSRNCNKFVLQMEARAKERERIKHERLEKHRRIEEEKKRQLSEKVAEQTKLELEEKSKREKLLKEKKEKDKQKEEARLKRIKWEQNANEKADKFYQDNLLKRYGIKAWYKLLSIKEENFNKANNNYAICLMQKTFGAWWRDVQEQIQFQKQIVKTFYDKILMRRCFYHMQLFKHRYLLMEQSADEHYLNYLLKTFFRQWRTVNHREQIRLDKLTIQSENLYERSLLKKAFIMWRKLPMAKRIERERERRKEIMRQKVASIIPDFKPKNLD